MQRTWDGLRVARDNPTAAAVVVWRRVARGREFLVLHRRHHGPEYAGDWAWTPPAGARQPGETPHGAARRELREEIGHDLPFEPLAHETDAVALFVAEAPPELEVRLDAEHDRYEWVTLEDALARCRPAIVARSLALADAAVSAAAARG